MVATAYPNNGHRLAQRQQVGLITMPDFAPDTRLIGLYVKWLEQHDTQHARNWAQLYKNDPEAAMCEATFWGVLTDCDVEVKPNADLTGTKKAPDFLCHTTGHRFYVEVTCIRIETATRFTGLTPEPMCGFYGLLTDAIREECRNKTPQCANQDAPCLLAIGTFHYPASTLCIERRNLEDVLTGETGFGWMIDIEKGGAVGEPYGMATLESAAFIRPGSDHPIEHVRHPISALLVGGFGRHPPHVYGLLNPRPVRPFDPKLLDRIPFCRLITDDGGRTMSTQWTDAQAAHGDG